MREEKYKLSRTRLRIIDVEIGDLTLEKDTIVTELIDYGIYKWHTENRLILIEKAQKHMPDPFVNNLLGCHKRWGEQCPTLQDIEMFNEIESKIIIIESGPPKKKGKIEKIMRIISSLMD